MHYLPGTLILVAGIVGMLPVDKRIAWAFVAIGGAMIAFA